MLGFMTMGKCDKPRQYGQSINRKNRNFLHSNFTITVKEDKRLANEVDIQLRTSRHILVDRVSEFGLQSFTACIALLRFTCWP